MKTVGSHFVGGVRSTRMTLAQLSAVHEGADADDMIEVAKGGLTLPWIPDSHMVKAGV